jgi:hypothetical protein
MIIMQKGRMPDGTLIQIEDWSKDYSFMAFSSTVAAYPISKTTHQGQFAPKSGEKMRVQFDFNSCDEADEAFGKLVEGEAELADFKDYLYYAHEADCL